MLKRLLIEFILFISISLHLIGQSECDKTFAYILGSILQDEKGYSLAASDNEKAIYIGGIKGDSAVIVKIDFSGKLVWIRALDIVQGREDHIMKILIDSEGMIAAAGIAGTTDAGGTIFVFRYNPVTNIILWSTEIKNPGVNYCNGLIQKGPGGHYLLIDNNLSPDNLVELIEIDKSNGIPNQQLSKHYDLFGPETLSDALYANGKIYGTGRFSFSAAQSSYRNTILRLNGDNGNMEWVKLGHKGNPGTARLYGSSLVLDQDQIYSVYCGDDNGTSLDQTNIFVQKTTEEGDLVWVKSYDIPGSNDWVDEIIKSDNGFVVMARNRISPSDIILFKIDTDGNVLWAKKFDYSANDNANPIGSTQGQLIEADQHLFFTAFSENSFSADMIIVKTDLNGNINDTCIVMTPINLVAKPISQTTWFSMEPDVTDITANYTILQPHPVNASSIQTKIICQSSEAAMSNIDINICNGDNYEGHTLSGQYTDHFISVKGCDSIRMLNLTVQSAIEIFNDISICQGETYEGYTMSGIYPDTFISNFGCDSIRTLTLISIEPVSTTIHASLCDQYLLEYTSVGTYVDTLQTVYGCDSIRTLVIDGTSKFLPNVFSPNDDGINDVFMVFRFPDDAYSLQYFAIFDRSGNMVFETRNWPIEWDGKRRNGTPFNPGVFVYVLVYSCGEEKITESGDITIVR